jgi:hypothetical protein
MSPGTGGPPPQKPLEALEAWKAARDAIKHEDDLVNHRLTWLLLLQGFLFTGLGATIQGIAGKGEAEGLLFCVAGVIAGVGFFSPFFVWVTLDAAVSHVHHVTRWWETKYEEYTKADLDVPEPKRYPPIRGMKYDNHRSRLFRQLARPIYLPWLLMTAWFILFVIGVLNYFTGDHRKVSRNEETITIPAADPQNPITIKRTQSP